MKSEERNCWRQLHQRVATEVTLREMHSSNLINQGVVKGILLGTSIILLLTLLVIVSYSMVWLLLWGALGVATFLLIVNCAHDASHRVLFKSAHANSWALLLPFALLGIDGALWGLRHRGAHHPHTNVSGEDTDSVPNPFLRLSPHE